MKLRLHIEQLAFEGFPLTQRQGEQVQLAVEQELARLLLDRGLDPRMAMGGAAPVLQGANVAAAGANQAAQFGTQVAGAVHAAIGGKP